MTVLSELNILLSDMSIQTETAKLSDKALDEYVQQKDKQDTDRRPERR